MAVAVPTLNPQKKKKAPKDKSKVSAAAIPSVGGEFAPLPDVAVWPSTVWRAMQPGSKKQLWLVQMPPALSHDALDGVILDLEQNKPLSVGGEVYAVLDNTVTLQASGAQAAAVCQGPDGTQVARSFGKFLTLAQGVLVPDIAAPLVPNPIILPPVCTTGDGRFQWVPFGTGGPEHALQHVPTTLPASASVDLEAMGPSEKKEKKSKRRLVMNDNAPAAVSPAKKHRKNTHS